MSSVDERIVQLTFDNDFFEKNVDTSIKSLEALDKALQLEGVDKSFSGIQKTINSVDFDGFTDSAKSLNNIDFSKLSNNVESLAQRFSARGIVIKTVIEDLVHTAERLGSKVARPINMMFSQIKTGGLSRARNIEQARFQIEGLKKDWDTLYQDMDYAVSGTAYGIDAAAKAAAQLSASGVEAGDNMKKALRGISGVAAMTNSQYEEISPIFTTVAGQGKLMTMQLRQLEARGLNTAAELGRVLGKSEAEIRDMVTKGQISFQQFSDAMDSAYGEHATAADKTFEGSLSNMKAALSRIGQGFFEPYRNNMIKIHVAMKELFNTIKKEKLTQVYEDVTMLIEKATGLVYRVIKHIDLSWLDHLIDGFHTVVTWIDQGLSALTSWWGPLKSFQDGFSNVRSSIEDVKNTVRSAFGIDAVKDIEKATTAIGDLNEIATSVINGDYGNGEERFKALTELTGSIEAAHAVQNKVNEMLNNPFRYDDALSEEAFAAGNYDKALTGLAKSFAEVDKAKQSIIDGMQQYKDAFSNAIDETEKASIFEWAGNVFTGFGNAVAVISGVLVQFGKGALNGIIRIGKTVGKTFGSIIEKISGWFTSLKTWMDETDAWTKIQEGANSAFEFLADIFDKIQSVAEDVFDIFGSAVGKIGDTAKIAFENVSQFWDKLKNTSAFKRASTFIDDLGASFENARVSIGNKLKELFGEEFEFPEVNMDGFVNSVTEKIDLVMDALDSLKNRFKSIFGGPDGIDIEKAVGAGMPSSIANTIEKENETVFTKIKNWWNSLSFEGMFTTFQGAFDNIAKLADSALDAVLHLGAGAVEGLGGGASVIMGWVDSFRSWLTEIGFVDAASQVAQNAFNGIQTAISTIGRVGGSIFKQLPKLLDNIGTAASGVWNNISTWWKGFTQTETFTTIATAFDNIKNKIIEIKNAITEKVTTFFDSIIDGSFFTNLKTNVGNLFKTMFGENFEFPTIDLGGALDFVADKIAWIIEKFKMAKEAITNFFNPKEALGRAGGLISGKGGIEDTGSSFISLSGILETVGGVLMSVGEIIKNVIDVIWNGAKVGISKVSGWLSDFHTWMKESGTYTKIQNGMTKAWNGFKNILKNIGPIASSVFGWLWDALKGIGSELINAKDKLLEWWAGFKESSAYSGASSIFSKIWDWIVKIKDILGEKVSGFLSDLMEGKVNLPDFKAGRFLEGIVSALEWSWDKIKTFGGDIQDLIATSFGFDSGTTILEMIKSWLGFDDFTFLDDLSQSFENAKNSILEFFGINTTSSFDKMSSAAEKGKKNLQDAAHNIFKGLNIVTENEAVKEVEKQVWSINDIVVDFADTLWGQALSLVEKVVDKMFELYDKVEPIINKFLQLKLTFSATNLIYGIASFAGNVSKAIGGFSKLERAKALELKARAFLELAIAIGVFAAAMWALGQLDEKSFDQAVKGLWNLVGALSVLMIVARFTIFRGSSGASSITEPIDAVKSALAEFGTTIAKTLTKFGIAAIIIAFAGAIVILIKAISVFAAMDTGAIIKGGAAVGIIAVALTALTGVLIQLSKNASGGPVIGAALAIAAFGVAIKLIADAISELGEMDTGSLIKGVGAVAVIGIVIGSALKKIKDVKYGPILAMIGVIASVALSMFALSFIQPARLRNVANSLLKAFAGVALIIAAIGLAGKGMEDLDTKSMIGMFAGIFVILAEVMAGLTLIATNISTADASKMDNIGDGVLKVLAGIGILVAGLGVFSKLSSGNIKKDLSGLGIAAIVAFILGVTGELNEALPKTKEGKSLLDRFAEGLGEWEEPMRKIGAVVGNLLGGFIEGIFGLNVGTSLGSLITTFFSNLVTGLSEAPEKLTEWAGEMTAMLDTMESESANWSTEGLTKFKEICDELASIGLEISILGDAINILKDTDLIDNATNLLPKFAMAMSNFSRTLRMNGFYASGNADMLKNATTIMDSYTDLISVIAGGVDAEGNKSFGTGQEDIESLENYIGNLERLANGLVNYAKAIQGMGEYIGAVEDTQAAVQIIQGIMGTAISDSANTQGNNATFNSGITMLDIAKNEDGSFDRFTTLDAYVQNLEPLANGLSTYATIMEEMAKHTDAVANTQSAAEIIQGIMSTAITDSEGMDILELGSEGNIEKVTALSTYISNLKPLGEGLTKYSEAIKDLRTLDVYRTSLASQMILSLLQMVPGTTETSALWGLLTMKTDGTGGLANIKDNLSLLGQGLVAFGDEIQGLNSEKVSKAVDPLNELLDVLGRFQSSEAGDALSLGLDTGALQTGLGMVSIAIGNVVDYLNGDSEFNSKLDAITEAAKGIGSKIMKAIEEGVSSPEGEDGSSADLSSIIQKKLFSGDSATGKASFAGEFRKKGIEAANALYQGLNMDLETNSETFKESIMAMFDTLLASIEASGDSYMSAGKGFMTNLLAGIISGGSAVTGRVRSFASNLVTTVRSFQAQMRGAGLYLMMGLADGISKGKSGVINTMARVAQETIAKAKEEFDQASPSKVFDEIGQFNMLGLAGGFEHGLPSVMKAVESTSNIISNGMADSIDLAIDQAAASLAAASMYIEQVMQDSMNTNPVITPVLDMSLLQNGMNSVNGMMGFNPAFGYNPLGYTSSLFPGSYMYSMSQQGMDSFATQSELRGIREDLRSLGEEMSHMQMVLDSGTLVGQITPDTDKELGNISRYKERWA